MEVHARRPGVAWVGEGEILHKEEEGRHILQEALLRASCIWAV